MFAKKWILYSRGFDFIFFFLPFIATYIFVTFGNTYFPNILYPENSPLWFFIFIIIFDVWHVWWTLYRWYLQKNILKKHWKLLIGIPIFSIISLIILCNIQIPWHDPLYVPLSFLAYMAVFHFIKQQVGFVQLYGRQAENLDSLTYISKKIDTIITWIVTGFPFAYWMMHYENISLNWFIPWEYIFISKLVPYTEFLWILYGLCIIIYCIFQLILLLRWARLNPLKYLYIIGTAYIWFNGMVAYDSIIIFGFGNILLHGLNYYGIVIWSTRSNIEAYGKWLEKIKKMGVILFSLGIVLSMASLWYIEEFFWNQFVWREKNMIFSDFFYNIWYSEPILILIVSILGSVQLTHYILDRYIWRWDFWKIN